MTIFTELKRRNVFRVASVYLITCWLILQIISVIAPALHIPPLFGTIVTVVLAIGFPVACIFAWAFELTPDGLKLTYDVDLAESAREQTGDTINYLLAGALVIALGFIAYEKLFVVSVDDDLERSIAVLPFEDMSQNKSQGYFGDGIAEEILNTLARLDKLVVISRTSSFGFKDKNLDIREIGRLLNVNYVLEGSVRKDKEKLRITAQLIDVQSGRHIWAQTYDRTLDNVFAVQDELTFAITQALKLNLLPEQVEHEAGMTTNPRAYELFIQARELGYKRTADALQQAAMLLNQAIAIDEEFYLARAQLYTVYQLAGDYGGFTPQKRKSEKKRLFWKLLNGPDFPLKQLVLGLYAQDSNKPDVATHFFELAYKNAPNETLIQNFHLLNMSDFDAVIAARKNVMRTNPESQVNYANLIYLYDYADQAQEAKEIRSAMNKKFPDSPRIIRGNMFSLYSNEQDIDKALAFLNNYTGEASSYYRRFKAGINLLSGNTDTTLDYLSEMLSESPEYEESYNNSLVLLYELSDKGKLSTQQQAKLTGLPITNNTAFDAKAFLSLLQGNSLPYAEVNQLQGLSPKEFIKKIVPGDIAPYYYAAIKKYQGDSRYAEILPQYQAGYLEACEQSKGKFPSCLLFMYLDGSFSQQQQLEAFENSFQFLNEVFIGDEYFIHTSPTYYGVNQDPEFEQVANEFLDKTFRKWNPQLQPAVQ
ncbi:MAG: TolB-like protein [Alphaproteobacteria bacterium]